ncbi:MAG: hypothetical protein U0176_12115 [Bacteroidia bacterium]
MKVDPVQKKALSESGESESKAPAGKSMAAPAFALTSQSQAGANPVQKKDAGVVQKQDAGGGAAAPVRTTPVIETTSQAWSHYMNGGGASVDIGPNSINSLINHPDFQRRHQRITGGLTTSLTGNFSVDMTSTIFHIGRTNIEYAVTCNGDQCTVNYRLFVNDGFWDVDFIDETVLGGLGFDSYQPDGMGPNLERFGGSPYHYNVATRSFTFRNPGY